LTAESDCRASKLSSADFSKSAGWERGHTFYGDQLAPVIEAASKTQQWIEHRQRQLQFAPETEGP
jgi:hypothetical protein